eukprot:Anaeramoba_ignava/c18743_g1_i1.p1 GENE.c18743_g1_i1~~c18743_g1_i1.p1  ORF type:complete len:381 (+),score=140.86 c18743_g1_i1:1214-2356(+)
MLQLLSNMVSVFGKKEIYMDILRDFMKEKKKQLTHFLDRLCEVEDLDFSQAMNNEISTNREKLFINIRLNEIYNFHDLMKKYCERISDDPEDPMKSIISTIGDAPKQVVREQNFTLELELVNQFSNVKQKKEKSKLYNQTKEMLATVYQQLTAGFTEQEMEQINFVKSIQRLRAEAKSAKDRKANRKLKKILLNMKKLLQEKTISKHGNYKKLREDIANYISQRNQEHGKIVMELETLSSVQEYVDIHTEYLRNQVKIYQEYLKTRKMSIESKQSEDLQKKKKAAIKYSFKEFDKTGALANSQIPKERQRFVFFTITPGLLNGSVVFEAAYRNRPNPICSKTIRLEELMELHQKAQNVLDLDSIGLNVNGMINLLKKNFL